MPIGHLVGGALGGTLGTLIMPVGGTAVGSVVGGILGGAMTSEPARKQFLSTSAGSVVQRITQTDEQSKALQKLAYVKFRSDLDRSCLSDRASAKYHRDIAINTALLSGFLKSGDARLPRSNFLDKIPSAAWFGEVSLSAIRALQKFGELRIFMASSSVGAIAIFNNNKQFLIENDIDIKIRFDAPYGIDLTNQLSGERDAHFAIAVDGPFFYSSGSVKRYYRYLFPLHSEPNRLIQRAGVNGSTSSIKRYYVVDGSSAHEAAEIRKEITNTIDKKSIDFTEISKIYQNIDFDEAIYVWHPLLLNHLDSKRFVYDEHSSYYSYRSLVCRRDLMRDKTTLYSFLELIIALWSRQPSKLIMPNILRDQGFLTYFSAALGQRRAS